MDNHEQYDILWEGLKDDYYRYEPLPMAVYISAKDGTFIKANEKAINLLSLGADYERKESILKYYINPRDREGVIKRLKGKGHNVWLENETLQFQFEDGNRKIRRSLRYFAKPFFVNQDNQSTWIGSISLVFEISEIERFRNLEELMPVGVFEVSGSEMELSYRNKKFNEILLIEEIGANVIKAEDLFMDESEFQILYEKLLAGKKIENEVVRLRRLSNHPNILASLNVVPEIYENDEGEKRLLKSKGFIQDITFGSFLDAPIGLYVVMRDSNDEEVITWANKEFSIINGLSNAEDCIGKSVKELYSETEIHVYKEFLEAFENAAKKDKYLVDYRLEFINKREILKQLYVHAKALKSKGGKIIGRVGAIIDISSNVKQQLQKEIDTDYAAFLHLYRAFVHDIQTTLYSIIKGHDSKVVIDEYEIDINKAFEVIKSSVRRLHKLLSDFLEAAVERKLVTDAFKDNILYILASLSNKLVGFEGHYTSIVAKAQASDIRTSIIEIRKRLYQNSSLKASMPSRPWKDTLFEISEVLRFARLISLWQLTIQAEGMFSDLDILSRAIKPGDSKDEKLDIFSIDEPLIEVKKDLEQYAKNERVSIRINYEIEEDLILQGNKRNIYAAIYNLTHNAIKYTWKKPSMMGSYISVTISRSERIINNKLIRFAKMAIENRGDAILKEEIKNKIFQFGYRGVVAVNSRKKGTGVGLWHTKKIIDEHNGYIIVKSEPIPERGIADDQNDYKKPFITTINIELPLI